VPFLDNRLRELTTKQLVSMHLLLMIFFLGFNYKFSEGKTKDVFKNAKLHYGGECLVDYFFNRRRTEDPQDPTFDSVNINTDHDIDLAVGPFVGLGYKISERFSIYTEGGFYIDFSYSIDKFSSDFTPTADFTDSVFSFREVFDFPDSIVLFYNF